MPSWKASVQLTSGLIKGECGEALKVRKQKSLIQVENVSSAMGQHTLKNVKNISPYLEKFLIYI